MFGFKSNLRVGLDIGTHAVKMIVAEKSGHGRQRFVAALSRDIYTGEEKYNLDGPKKMTIVPLVLEMFQEVDLRPKRVAHLGSCVGGANIAAKEILTMQMSEEEMDSSILNEARKHLPLDGSETVVDYQVLGDDTHDADKIRVLIAATTKRIFDAHLDVLRELELKPGIIDLEPLSAINSYLSHIELPDDGVIVFLNLGARRTNLLITGRKDVFFARDLPVGGYAFTEEIMQKMDISFPQAEELKKTRGIQSDNDKAAGEAAPGLALRDKAPLDKLSDEINRSLRYYVKETGQSFFHRIVLVGGPAASEGLQKHIEEKFNVEVTPFDPLTNFEGVGDVSNRPQYAAAAGLAARAQSI